MTAIPDRPAPPPSKLVHAAKVRLLGNLDALAADPTARSDDGPLVAQSPTFWPGPAHTGDPADTDRYSFGEAFAAGGLGLVRRAEDRRLGRTIAVKELLHSDPAAARRFALEANITARLQHPGIVPLYDIGRHPDGAPYYCMKLVDGHTLEQKIRGCAGLPARLALLEHVIAAADAIAYAHRNNILHRDLKPANILVGELGETVVIDWGLAKDTTHQPTDVDSVPAPSTPETDAAISTMTAHGTVLGTLRYMPPEQARGEPVDVRGDVFSLGAVLFHVLAGAAPFAGVDNNLLAARVAAGACEDLRTLVPDAPRELVAITRRAMAPRPDDRYASAGALAEDLRRFLAGRLVGAHRYSTGDVLRRWVHRHRAVTAVAAASLTVLSISGLFAVQNIRHERDAAAAGRDQAERARGEAEQARSIATRRADDASIAHARGMLSTDLPAVAHALAGLTGDDASTWRAAHLLASAAAARGLPHRILHAGPAPLTQLRSVGEQLLGLDDRGNVWRWQPDATAATHVLALGHKFTTLASAADAPVWAAVATTRAHVFTADAALELDTSHIHEPQNYSWHLTPDGHTLAAFAERRAPTPAARDDAAYFWDLRDPTAPPTSFGLSRRDVPHRVVFSADARHVAVTTTDSIHLLDRATAHREVLPRIDDRIAEAILPDHLILVDPLTRHDDPHALEIVDRRTRATRRIDADSVHVLGDDDILLANRGAQPRTLTRHTLSTATDRWTLHAHTLWNLAVDPTNTRFVVEQQADQWAVADLASGHVVHTLGPGKGTAPTWLGQGAVVRAVGPTVHVWQPSAAPLAITHVGSNCALSSTGQVAVLAPRGPHEGFTRVDLTTGAERPIACPRPPPPIRSPFTAADSYLIGVAVDDRGRTLALSPGWNCWSDDEATLEIPAARFKDAHAVALTGGGFVTSHGEGDIQVWQEPTTPSATWTLPGPQYRVAPDATGQHIAVVGAAAIHILHRAGTTMEQLPLEFPGGMATRAIAWSPQGSTLAALRSLDADLELTLWTLTDTTTTQIERHVIPERANPFTPFLGFDPTSSAVVFDDRKAWLTVLDRAHATRTRIPLADGLLAGHFLADDRLLAVDFRVGPLLVDLAAHEVLALHDDDDPSRGFDINIPFGQASPDAPVWMCNAIGPGTLARWTDPVPTDPAAMRSWLALTPGA